MPNVAEVVVWSALAPLQDLVWDVAPALARENPERWVQKLGDEICSRYGLDEIAPGSDLASEFEKLFARAVERFRADLNANDLKRLRGFSKAKNCFQWLGAKLRKGNAAPVVESRGGVVRVAPDPGDLRRAARAWRELELREFELWPEFQTWLAREQKQFRWMYRNGYMSDDGSTVWLKRSIRSFAKKLQCSEPTVKRALRGLRRRGVVGWIHHGDQWTGSTVYWISRSRKAVAWGRMPSGRRRGWRRKPPK